MTWLPPGPRYIEVLLMNTQALRCEPVRNFSLRAVGEANALAS